MNKVLLTVLLSTLLISSYYYYTLSYNNVQFSDDRELNEYFKYWKMQYNKKYNTY